MSELPPPPQSSIVVNKEKHTLLQGVLILADYPTLLVLVGFFSCLTAKNIPQTLGGKKLEKELK